MLSYRYTYFNKVLRSTCFQCLLTCNKGICAKYTNVEKFFCHCDTGWSGAQCHIPVNCNDCSSDSVCVGSIQNRSICICPLNKFGPRCLLTHSCRQNTCQNNGLCVVTHISFAEDSFVCICSEQFYGNRCEKSQTELKILFENMKIPSHMTTFIITVNKQQKPIQRVMLKKLSVFRKYVILYIADNFHMVFIKIDRTYYLIVIRQSPQSRITTSINAAR